MWEVPVRGLSRMPPSVDAACEAVDLEYASGSVPRPTRIALRLSFDKGRQKRASFEKERHRAHEAPCRGSPGAPSGERARRASVAGRFERLPAAQRLNVDSPVIRPHYDGRFRAASPGFNHTSLDPWAVVRNDGSARLLFGALPRPLAPYVYAKDDAARRGAVPESGRLPRPTRV